MSDGALRAEVQALAAAVRTMEQELFASVSAGSRSAMARLHHLYLTRLYSFFLYVTDNDEHIEPLISDTMFEVWQRRATTAPDAGIPAWIMRIAYSFARKHQQGSKGASGSPLDERAVLHLAYSSRYSRQCIAMIMEESCERIDELIAQATRVGRNRAQQP